MHTKPKFVYDEAGNRVEVIFALSDYQAMLEAVEDAEDRAIFEQRRHEETVPWESVKAKLMNHPANLENAPPVPPAIADARDVWQAFKNGADWKFSKVLYAYCVKGTIVVLVA